MKEIVELMPLLYSSLICLIYLLLVSGTRYSLKKTIAILVPFMALILAANIIIFSSKGYDSMKNWYIISVFIPESILVSFVSKRKGLSLITGLFNTFLIFYFVLVLYIIADRFTYRVIFSILLYVGSIPVTSIVLYFFYNRLHNIVEKYLKGAFWLMLAYTIIILLEINIYRILFTSVVSDTSRYLSIETFAAAILSVYLVSIVGFYIFLTAYERKMISNFDNDILKRQVKNVIKISKVKRANEEKLKVLRHDLKHLLVSLSSLITNNESQKALELINTYNISIEETQSKNYCNDPLINSILEYYNNKCLDNDIVFTTKINDFESILDVPVEDLVIVISNCLDNAINACLRIPNKRYINFIFLNNDERLIMQIKNGFDGKIQFDDYMYPTNPESSHGYGTKSIKNFAKKHNINFDYIIKDNSFEITFLFNQKKNKQN